MLDVESCDLPCMGRRWKGEDYPSKPLNPGSRWLPPIPVGSAGFALKELQNYGKRLGLVNALGAEKQVIFHPLKPVLGQIPQQKLLHFLLRDVRQPALLIQEACRSWRKFIERNRTTGKAGRPAVTAASLPGGVGQSRDSKACLRWAGPSPGKRITVSHAGSPDPRTKVTNVFHRVVRNGTLLSESTEPHLEETRQK